LDEKVIHACCPDARRRALTLAGLGGALLAIFAPGRARAQAWPAKLIKFVSATAPGGAIDATARLYGEYIAEKLGVQVLVENRPGGHSVIAGEYVAKSRADGYTFLFAVNSALTQGPILLKRVPFDATRDFAMLAGFSPGPALFLCKQDLAAQTLREFVDLSRRQRTLVGSIGVGSRAHLIGEQMKKLLGSQMEIVHYKGAGPALADLAGGQIDCTVGSYAGSLPFLSQKRMRVLAISSGSRSPKFPGVPTFADEGFTQPVFRLRDWLTLAAPAGTPRPVLERLGQLIQEANATPKVAAARDRLAISEAPLVLDEFEKALAEERPVWQQATRDLGITLD